jgi:dienelactone hydrolase
MLPSKAVDWVTPTPQIEKVVYPTQSGQAAGEIYRPPTPGPHPGIVVCLGVVPFEVDHPQVPVLGRALARAGFVALLYWSPAMRDFRFDAADIENIALAYHWLIEQPFVDPARSGLLGTCVGGSFALMAAASPLIREQLAFLAAYAPYSSMWTFAKDIASATRSFGDLREPWQVDQLTRRVFVHSLVAWLKEDEAQRFHEAFENGGGVLNPGELSLDGKAVYALLTATNEDQANAALKSLPNLMQQQLSTLSPINYLQDIHTPAIILLHDRGDQVIPVFESRRLFAALNGFPRAHYTEMQFSHLDPVKGKLPFHKLVRELLKLYRAVFPLFKQSMAK